ncbi:MAG: hypothetical protein NTU49_10560 [Gammaproteobacteria bacterium]|nr:hypothetical protein [Gammaproteobacteria bacterium]
MKNSISNAVCIFQPYLNDEQCKLVNPAFVPFDHSKNPNPDQREYLILKTIFEGLGHIKEEYIGLFSQRFGKKSLLDADQVLNHIAQNPGHDIYLFNPFPQNDLMFYNVWDQGEFCHKHITALTQDVLNETYPEIILDHLGRSRQKTVYCNFWVAKKSFWEDFMPFLLTIGEKMISTPEKYFKNTTYHMGDMPIFTFIIERLISTYLMAYNKHTFLPYQYPDNFIQRLIHHEYEGQLYQRLSILVRKLDKQYGDTWPASAKKELIDTRLKICGELAQLGYSTKNRY